MKDELAGLEALVGRAIHEIERLARCCAESEAREAELRARLDSRPEGTAIGLDAAWAKQRVGIVDELRAAVAELRGE